ncbi:hypothetical protein QFZ63_000164 [Streptomyces sp. B3I7]|uniref:hypothetical protein n=1 Tax=Streptomyces sp. B3I7 TaxID=3042269 RepID=UPI002783FB3E|nr:hypothetical protein [Streptomyces sp. B3I7]MDQ0808450.1 hypothetical protein [Streptomyces sp. B3I7]
MFTREEAEFTEERQFWKQRSWIASASFLAATLLVSAVAFAVSGGSSGDKSGRPISAAAKSDPLALASKVGGAERPAGCATDDAGQDLPRKAPQDTKFRPVGTFRVPTSPSAGPLKTNGPVAWCYAHTPMGAVMAAHMITSRMSSPDWRTVADEQLVPGRSRDSFAALRSTVVVSKADGPTGAAYEGFSVSDYSQQTAKIGMLIRSTKGVVISTTVSMRWSGGDWKVEPLPDGSLYTPISQETSNGQFHMWKK